MGQTLPLAVARIYPRTDKRDHVMHGIEVRVGDSPDWRQSAVCAGPVSLEITGITVVNCFGTGRYAFVVAPAARDGVLALCEFELVPRGPSMVHEWRGTIGRGFSIKIHGAGLGPDDRIRVVEPTVLCGSEAAFRMHPSVVERTAPSVAPNESSVSSETWHGVNVLTMGLYKVCWCSGLTSGCTSGLDFYYVAGFAVVAGELRTVVGTGQEASVLLGDDAAGPSDPVVTRAGLTTGVAVTPDGMTLFYSEPHRVRRISLLRGEVETAVGDLRPGVCPARCGDGLTGNVSRLFSPRGLAVCGNELLIADAENNRIRSYNLQTGIVTTVAGSGEFDAPGYSGDGGPPEAAKLKLPSGIACYEDRGFIISDTGNNAVRLVRPGGSSKIIETVMGGRGLGLSAAGAWSSTVPMIAPQQLEISNLHGLNALSFAYVEGGNALGRYVPLGAITFEGPIQPVLGTGSVGYRMETAPNGDVNFQLNNPEGLAIHRSTMFVADTKNHRIVMAPILEYQSIGCYKEYYGSQKLIPSVEGEPGTGLQGEARCDERFQNTRWNAIQACARAALAKGFDLFALRCGGLCAGSYDAHSNYRRLGWSSTCNNGLGSMTANSMYQLVRRHAPDVLGKAYLIAGSAMSTEVWQAVEEPRSGWVGDRGSSWISSVNEPAQLAIDPLTHNLYFADRKNFRIRVIFGELGPRPTTQAFRCVNGHNCTLTLTGNALSEADHIAFTRATGNIVCGRERLESQFPRSWRTRADGDPNFKRKDFQLGQLGLYSVGEFKICYCIGNAEFAGRECMEDTDFEFGAGSLTVVGPNSEHKFDGEVAQDVGEGYFVQPDGFKTMEPDLFRRIDSLLDERAMFDQTSTKSETGLTEDGTISDEMMEEWTLRLGLQDQEFAIALAREANDDPLTIMDSLRSTRKWYHPYIPYMHHAMRCFVYLASPIVGILPWSLHLPWLSTLYQWIILSIFSLAVAHAGKTSYEDYTDNPEDNRHAIVYIGDTILATGALAGLFCCGAYWRSYALVRCIRLLQAYNDQTGFCFEWKDMSLKDFGIYVGIWFVCVTLRLHRTIIYLELPTVHVIYFGVASALLMGMSGFVLHTCRCLSNMTDTFCYRVIEEITQPKKFKATQMEWSLLQSLCRATSSSIQYLFLALEGTMMGIALLLITQVSYCDITRIVCLVPSLMVASTVMRVSISAAMVTDKCARVPTLVNSISVGGEEDQEKMYCVHYLHYSRAGFYVGEILLTSSTIIKTAYVLCAVAFGLATQVL